MTLSIFTTRTTDKVQTIVGIHQKAAYASESNFFRPLDFIPERWLEIDPSSAFGNHDKSIFEPFSFGPRDCLGKSLAYTTMRLTLAKLFYSYDIRLSGGSSGWADQKIFQVWDEKPLMCYDERARLVD